MLSLTVLLVAARLPHRSRADAGQTTAEYALVLLGAASIALLVLTWATQTDKVEALLNSIMNHLMDQIG